MAAISRDNENARIGPLLLLLLTNKKEIYNT